MRRAMPVNDGGVDHRAASSPRVLAISTFPSRGPLYHADVRRKQVKFEDKT